MRVLVTGGAGYIGSVTNEILLDAGHDVVVLDNFERGHRGAIDARATVVECDLRDRDSTLRAVKDARPDAVMHFAAYALVSESMAQPEEYFRNNLVGGIHLAEAMHRAEVSTIVFSSTCATYGQPDTMPIHEDTPQRPANPYGESKLAFERVLNWYRELHDMTTVFLRYFNACGATERFGEDHEPEMHLVPIVLQAALGKRDKVFIYGDDYDTPDGTCLRDYIHIIDLAQAHLRALERGVSGAFNLGNGKGYSVREVIEAAREVTGKPIPTATAPRRPGDPDQLVAAADKAATTLEWRPSLTDLRVIIESAWRWHQAHPDGYGD